MSTKENNILISPSIIAADLTTIGEQARTFDAGIVSLLHLDVMDGNFVPNLTFGPGFIGSLKKHTAIPLDVHLMIEKPERSIGEYLEIKPWVVTIHYESTRFPARILQQIRKAGVGAGIAINPATPVESIFDLLPYADMALVMSVDPGFYGQAFMEPAIGRIRKLAAHIRSVPGLSVRIQVDGGIGPDNIARVVEAGADIIVAGNAAFKGGDVNKNVRELRARAGV
ncbi:MAG TPA: ribulose-phosphate 3-epimerase [Spirochaetota bacterium]|nr:ribulose-phosphate 3-epimerase [Spirochaetota bacterium]HPC39826.1 ribulose-phosphate 3-epimerase [Spirochaetota bacterium]HPL16308.1 ribulose-phosphate 3-epimerase [Spirochaetota bacterium]HQF09873.1 ribulose-phosphate 3-epimerase [Spirochaetota bacterium]HQH98523.1 ribulose-phosphate 3-epimerase [Spirochaetota bacterium]